jgi:hypothetical protein
MGIWIGLIAAFVVAEPAPETPATGVSFQISSWGRRGVLWTIDENGDGALREARGPDQTTEDADVAVLRFHVGREGFARLQAAMAPLIAGYAERGIACDHIIPDGPEGDISWRWPGSSGRISLWWGCQGDASRPAFELVDRVDGLVTGWARRQNGPANLERN